MGRFEKVEKARDLARPNIYDYINNIFDDFIELKGDRCGGDDSAIIGGIAFLNNQPVTIIGHLKGHDLNSNLKVNFGMGSPSGYRKALRLMEQAHKFNRPIISFIDTPGAYPGVESEQKGIGEAIARCIEESFNYAVPKISIIIGEGGSGGALGFGVSDQVVMLENAVYSILSPEGFAAILFKDKDGSRKEEAAELMKLTALDLLEQGIIDKIIPEGDLNSNNFVYDKIGNYLSQEIQLLSKLDKKTLLHNRYERFRKF